MAANPHLARALRFRARRWHLKRWMKDDGLVDPSPAALALAAPPPRHPRLLGDRAAGLRRLPVPLLPAQRDRPGAARGAEPIEDLDALQRGSLVHRASTPRRTSCARPACSRCAPPTCRPRWRCSTRRSTPRRRAARGAGAGHRARVGRRRRPHARGPARVAAPPGRRAVDAVQLRAQLRPAARPRGRSGQPARAGRARLRPAPARRDRPGRAARRCVRATDHKTGARRARRLVIGGGEPCSRCCTRWRWRSCSPTDGRLRPAVLLHRARRLQRGDVPLDDAARAAVARMAATVTGALDARLSARGAGQGRLHLCDYRTVCGPYEEQRAQTKDRRRLEPLVELRRHP